MFCEKAHIVAGKIPPKYPGAQWLFVKAEHFGTQNAADQIGHTVQLGKSLAGASKGEDCERTCECVRRSSVAQAIRTLICDVGPKHLRGPKRVENVDKAKCKAFCSILNTCYNRYRKSHTCIAPQNWHLTNPHIFRPVVTSYLPGCELTLDELCERAKVVGMSFSYPKVLAIDEAITQHTTVGLHKSVMSCLGEYIFLCMSEMSGYVFIQGFLRNLSDKSRPKIAAAQVRNMQVRILCVSSSKWQWLSNESARHG